jgi:hypothetical protein
MFRITVLAVAGILFGLTSLSAPCSTDVIDAFFVADKPFPEFVQYWSDLPVDEWSRAAERESQRVLGGYIHAYVRNNSTQRVAMEDVLLQGISLKKAIAYSDQRKFKKVAYAASIHFSKLPKSQLDTLVEAGEPVWWKVDPVQIEPGATASVVIRVRRQPALPNVSLRLELTNGHADISVSNAPRKTLVKSIGFSSGLSEAFLYFERPRGESKLERVLLDGNDITKNCTIGSDPRVDIAPVVCKLPKALDRASFHCFTGIFSDGSKATAGLRCWDHELFYGVWGARPGKANDLDLARRFIRELAEHNVNGHMVTIASDAVRVFMNSPEGRQLMEQLGIRRVVTEHTEAFRPAAYYLADEPDTADYKVEGVPASSKIGCLGQGLVERANELRNADPLTPNMLNVDMTFKPDNWYTYGQLPDIFAADPYFQSHLADVYYQKLYKLPAYTKATEVYAVASCSQSACAPKPLHIILNSTQVVRQDWKFRFATPIEKRIEVYYALAAGAKAFSYWWFVPLSARGTGSNGLGADTPEARSLWREIGLLGAEVRTAGPIITKACPVNIEIEAHPRLWVRSLASGLDTIVLVVVNDDYACDRAGTVVRPVDRAKLSLRTPDWLSPKAVFEISCDGVQDVKWDAADSRLDLDLGTVNVTRFIVVTSDPDLRSYLQALYDSKFASNVAKLRLSQ